MLACALCVARDHWPLSHFGINGNSGVRLYVHEAWSYKIRCAKLIMQFLIYHSAIIVLSIGSAWSSLTERTCHVRTH